ncbi:MAG: MerR family transcriptional regulator [Clostridiales bacterium]|nr:MerR family transcriptional regulator [Candidatus Crickella merdequi]
MIYRAGWIEKNMGVSRKSLRVYEAKGLISPAINKRNNKYRDYTERDLVDIWNIKLLRGLGVPLSEIKMVLLNTAKLGEVLESRIAELEAEVERLERNIRVAVMIREAGKLPEPPEMGSVTYSDYLNDLCEKGCRL